MKIKFIPYLFALVVIIFNTELLNGYNIKVTIVFFVLLIQIGFLLFKRRISILDKSNPIKWMFDILILSLFATTLINNNYENIRIVLVITLFFFISISYVQLFTFEELSKAYVNVLFIIQILNIANMAISGEISEFIYKMSSLKLHRINGFFSGNNISGFLSALGLIINYTSTKRIGSLKNLVFLITLIFSNNRFSFLIIVFAWLAISFFSTQRVNKQKYIVIFTLLIVVVTAILLNEYATFYFSRDSSAVSIYSGDNKTLNGRFGLWAYSIDYLLAQPFMKIIFGVGYGNIFNTSYLFESRLMGADFSTAPHMHNSYINILFHSGLICFVFLLILLRKIIIAVINVRKKETLLFIIIISFLWIGITEPFIWSESVFSLMFFIGVFELSERFYNKKRMINIIS